MVKSKWVYANKYNNEGHIVARKAQLVVKGFMQILGEDYDETYASVMKLESVWLVCAIATSLGLRLLVGRLCISFSEQREHLQNLHGAATGF